VIASRKTYGKKTRQKERSTCRHLRAIEILNVCYTKLNTIRCILISKTSTENRNLKKLEVYAKIVFLAERVTFRITLPGFIIEHKTYLFLGMYYLLSDDTFKE